MRARDLTDEDIGRSFLVEFPTAGLDRRRIVFEGFSRRPKGHEPPAVGIFWMIMKVSPGTDGSLLFREASGQVFHGVLVRSSSQVWPLNIDYAVTETGEIVETACRAA